MKIDPLDEHVREDLIDLANQVCDQSISEADRSRLEILLSDHAELRELYLAYLHVNAKLIWRFRTGEPTSRSPDADLLLDIKSSQLTKVGDKHSSQKNEYRLRGPGLIVAALCACIFIAAMLNFFASSDDTRASKLTRSDLPTTNVNTSKLLFVATLREATDAVWNGSGQPIDVSARIKTGQLRLASGEAELVFDSGAKLILAGPAKLRLDSTRSVFLEHGKLVAHIPPSAVGFTILTPTSKLVDQGTEFGVVADASGATELHVFRGQVDLHYHESKDMPDSPRKLKLLDRQARRITQQGGIGDQVEFSTAPFGNLATRIAEPLLWKASEGGNGHYYQFVVRDKPVTWHEAAWLASNSFHRGMQGHLVTITSDREDEFLIKNFIQDLSTRGIWIGLTDVLREGEFRWITGEPFEYANWASWPVQQPDNFREADWHGGEDYGMFTRFPDKQSWAWNDLSTDSIHERVSTYLVEFEPTVDALQHRSVAQEPIFWTKEEGGSGHAYRLVLSLESSDWPTISQRATNSSYLGVSGHLLTLETPEEREFVTNKILRVCGIPQNMIGLTGSLLQGKLEWITGEPVGNLEIDVPNLPTDLVYGMFCWDASRSWPDGWRMQAISSDVLPAGWFGYIVEYAIDSSDRKTEKSD